LSVLTKIGRAAQSVAIVSSVDQAEMIEAAKKLGVKEYITKPFDANQVLTLLDSLDFAPDGGLVRGTKQ